MLGPGFIAMAISRRCFAAQYRAVNPDQVSPSAPPAAAAPSSAAAESTSLARRHRREAA